MAYGAAKRTAGDHHVGCEILGSVVQTLVGGCTPGAPDLYTAFNPWDRITTSEAVCRLLHDGGLQNFEVTAEDGYQTLRTPEDFWTIALGSGLRWTIDQMGAELAQEVKHEVLDSGMRKPARKVSTTAVSEGDRVTILLEQTVPVSRGFRVDASCCSLLFMRADTSQNDPHEKGMMLNPSLHHCHVKSPR